MTTTPITPERPPPEFNNWTEVWDEHQLRGTQLRSAATTIASLRAENERLKACQDICRVCGPDAKGCSHIQPRRLLLAEIDRLRTLLAAAQAECEAAGTLIETLADRGRKTLQAAAWKKYNAARRKVQG
jgi:uncharacterized small protein (DUF1192 family)